MKYILTLATLVLASVSSYGQLTVSVSYGSGFSGADGSIFTDSTNTTFDAGNNAVIAYGWSDGFSGGSSVGDYLSDFNILGFSDFTGATPSGFIPANGSFDNDDEVAAGKIGYLFILAGITDFANASSATEFAIFNDSSWAVVPTGSLTGELWELTSVSTVDNIVFGAQVASGGFGNGAAFATSAVPEPSTFAALAGVFALSAVMVRRRRA